VYAAGDIANFQHAALGKRVRVEHEDNAVQMGKLAGRNMADAQEAYTHTPMFYSDLFDLGYEAVGEINSKLETVTDWQEPFQKGVIYYLENQHVGAGGKCPHFNRGDPSIRDRRPPGHDILRKPS
jgi:NADPH-dependent 2,4-dienoyl-CoA reductase/sulfur reductase-like enzyme